MKRQKQSSSPASKMFLLSDIHTSWKAQKMAETDLDTKIIEKRWQIATTKFCNKNVANFGTKWHIWVENVSLQRGSIRILKQSVLVNTLHLGPILILDPDPWICFMIGLCYKEEGWFCLFKVPDPCSWSLIRILDPYLDPWSLILDQRSWCLNLFLIDPW